MRMSALTIFLSVTLSAALPAAAQTSASFRLGEWTLNAGGTPAAGAVAASPNFKVTLSAIGDPLGSGSALASPGFRMDGGFVSAFPPPGEVLGLRFAADRQTLTWDPEPSAGTYDVYRALLGSIATSFGTCAQSRIADTTWVDTSTPAAATGYFYLVTVRNRLDQEGPKGYQSSGAEEPNPSPCP